MLNVAPEVYAEESPLRKSLEELLKLMLVIWCKENQANKVISAKPDGKLTTPSLSTNNKYRKSY